MYLFQSVSSILWLEPAGEPKNLRAERERKAWASDCRVYSDDDDDDGDGYDGYDRLPTAAAGADEWTRSSASFCRSSAACLLLSLDIRSDVNKTLTMTMTMVSRPDPEIFAAIRHLSKVVFVFFWFRLIARVLYIELTLTHELLLSSRYQHNTVVLTG